MTLEPLSHGATTPSGVQSCSAASSATQEPLAGTAGRATLLLALAWPKPLWHPDKAVRSEGLPPELAALEQSEANAGRKLVFRLFQRAPRPSTERIECIAFRSADASAWRVEEIPLGEVPQLIERLLAGESAGERLGPGASDLLVCTDGRHDRCCAEHGRAFYTDLCDEIESRGRPFRIAESSHLGGHRFAANLLLLPEGRLYGRLRREQVASLVSAIERRCVWTPGNRGRIDQDEVEQVAEACARARHPEASSVELIRRETLDGGGEVRVELGVALAGTQRRVHVRLHRRRFESPTSCDRLATLEPRQRWVAAD